MIFLLITKIPKIMKTIIEILRNSRLLTASVLVAVVALVIRLLFAADVATSALLYVAVPFSICVVLLCADTRKYTHWAVKYFRAFRASFVILFAVSIVLFEGFICVLMLMPIYIIMTLFAMACEWLWRTFHSRPNGTAAAYALPLIALIASLEGTHTSLSFERANSVVVTQVVDRPVEELRANLDLPFDLRTDRHWFLRIFSMPAPVGKSPLTAGDIHSVDFTYHRWLVTNTHRGRMRVEISDVGARHVTTTVREDTSYISHYLDLRGTQVDLNPLDASTTEVMLTVHFDRKLDPAWYFDPLERYGIRKMAEFLIQRIIIRCSSEAVLDTSMLTEMTTSPGLPEARLPAQIATLPVSSH